MNVRKKIAKDINYQIETVYFMLHYPQYKEKLDIWYKERESSIMQEYEKGDDDKKLEILRNHIVPDILENEKNHFNVIYWNMMLNAQGREFIKYLKENGQ